MSETRHITTSVPFQGLVGDLILLSGTNYPIDHRRWYITEITATSFTLSPYPLTLWQRFKRWVIFVALPTIHSWNPCN